MQSKIVSPLLRRMSWSPIFLERTSQNSNVSVCSGDNAHQRKAYFLLCPILCQMAAYMAYQRRRGEGGVTQLASLKGITLGDGNVLCEGFSRNGRFSLHWAQVAR